MIFDFLGSLKTKTQKCLMGLFNTSKNAYTLQLHTFSVYELQKSRTKSATTPKFCTFLLFCPKRGL